MLSDAERQLRKSALVLSVLLGFVVLYGAARLVFLAEPEPVLPAASSLQYGDPAEAVATEEMPPDFVTRPVFWVSRMAYVPPEIDADPEEPVQPGTNSELDKVQLKAVFGAGENSSIIISYKGNTSRLKLNETIAGWTFTQFSPDGAVFANDTDIKAIRLEHAKPIAVKPRQVARVNAASSGSRGSRSESSRSRAGGSQSSSKNKVGKGGDASDKDSKKDKKKKKKKKKNKGDK